MPQKRSHYEKLRKKWGKRHAELQQMLSAKHGETLHWVTNNTRNLAVGGAAGLLLLQSTTPLLSGTLSAKAATEQHISPPLDRSIFLMNDMRQYLPSQVGPLSDQQKQVIGQILSRYFHMDIEPSLNGISLNRVYGYIGAEQHLARYPGDTMSSHFSSEEDADKYWSSGMAPGLGAWGYFAPSQSEMTEEDAMREKYYIAVQTFLAPGYMEHTAEYSNFFKYHKMLVLNPENGKALVAVIGDAGPAAWTGKQLGGSPEVMKYLERVDGAQKGPVLYYFINDPDNTIPLGPIEVQ